MASKNTRILTVMAVAISLVAMTVQGQSLVSRRRQAQDSQAAFAQGQTSVSRQQKTQDSQTAFAQGQEQLVDVVATGYGTTVREATRAALRSAVEQVVGTMIDATTLVENDKLIEDEILSYSAGMIASSKVIGEPKKSEDGIFTVKVKASVKKGRLQEKLRSASAVNVALDGADLFARMTAAKDNLADAEAMIKAVLAKHKDCVIAETIPGKNGKSPIDLDPKTGEVFVNVRVRVDQAKYTQFANEVVEKIGAMATKKIKLKPDPSYYPTIRYGFDAETYPFLIMTSPRNGSAVAFQLDENILDAILLCLDTGSIAVSATLYDAQGAEIADGNVALCGDRRRYKSWMSLFACGERRGCISPFYFGNSSLYSDEYKISEGGGTGMYRMSLGKFTPEELKSVGNLKIKVGHMKDNQFSE